MGCAPRPAALGDAGDLVGLDASREALASAAGAVVEDVVIMGVSVVEKVVLIRQLAGGGIGEVGALADPHDEDRRDATLRLRFGGTRVPLHPLGAAWTPGKTVPARPSRD